MGMPAKGPGSPPAAITWSMPSACSRARWASTATNALTWGFSASIRSRAWAVKETAVRCPERTWAARSVARSMRKSMSIG